MATSRDKPLEERLLSAKEAKGEAKRTTITDMISSDNFANGEDANIIKPKNVSNTCRCPFNKHDRPLLFMVIGLALLFSGFVFLKTPKLLIVAVK